MDKHLPDNIDDFFSDRLSNYSEEPGEQSWSEINKRLFEIENKRKGLPSLTILSAAAIIVACLTLPFLLVNPYLHKQQSLGKKSANKKFIENNTMNNDIPFNLSINKKPANNSSNAQNSKEVSLNHQTSQQDFSVAGLPVFNNLYQMNAEDEHLKLNFLLFQNDFEGLMSKSKSGPEKKASTIIKFSGKHNFSISPFFSFDHITGRFIEQYEFDNASKNDYTKREKPNPSFTVGVLTTHKLNKKFSLLTGLSFSTSNLSISSTAVSALKDENGVYKFKLATSYGLAEITKSGITPAAGDSLFVSSANMQFNYISFPVLINYNISNKKIKFNVHAGLALNKMLGEKVEAEYNFQNNDEAETINKIEGIKKTFFTLNTGIEATYNVKRNIGISLSPELRYGINSINKQTPIKTYPINYGLAFHVNIRL